MKLRTDFVTNSSSSSFIFIGLKLDNIPKSIHNVKKLYMFGRYTCDGDDIVILNQEMLDYVNQYEENFKQNYRFYYGILDTDGGENVVNLDELKKQIEPETNVNIISGDATQNYTDNYEDFVERFKEGESSNEY